MWIAPPQLLTHFEAAYDTVSRYFERRTKVNPYHCDQDPSNMSLRRQTTFWLKFMVNLEILAADFFELASAKAAD
jgi:hypothetical protein